jgi:hypothetical protein
MAPRLRSQTPVETGGRRSDAPHWLVAGAWREERWPRGPYWWPATRGSVIVTAVTARNGLEPQRRRVCQSLASCCLNKACKEGRVSPVDGRESCRCYVIFFNATSCSLVAGHRLHSFTLKTEAAASSETSVLICRHIPQDSRSTFTYYHDYKFSPLDLVLNKVEFND